MVGWFATLHLLVLISLLSSVAYIQTANRNTLNSLVRSVLSLDRSAVRPPQQNHDSSTDGRNISSPKPEISTQQSHSVPSYPQENIPPSTDDPEPANDETLPQRTPSKADGTSSGKIQPPQPVEQLILVGERHSGTDWITDYLTACFQDDINVTNTYVRGQYWFQDEGLSRIPENSGVVVAMFRDPYDWVEAMRVEPHHAHDHFAWPEGNIRNHREDGRSLGWRDFVSKPWTGQRGPGDRKVTHSPGGRENVTCWEHYKFDEIVPCSEEDSPGVNGLGTYHYELQHDGSGRAYSSIIDLRRDKIKNLLSLKDFAGTKAFFPYRYEDLKFNGTANLLRDIEESTGRQAKCESTLGNERRRLEQRPITKYRELPDEYIKWMSRYVDWDVENQIGYYKIEETSSAKDEPTKPVKTKNESTKPAMRIALLGERHSGTNWITDYLTACFQEDIQVTNTYTRFKHWFQDEDLLTIPENSVVVVAMFRDPYDWVEAMRVKPHHAHDHVKWVNKQKGKSWARNKWRDFVTKPWAGQRGPGDRKIIQTPGGRENVTCEANYKFDEWIPCVEEDYFHMKGKGLSSYKYELHHDGSGRAYSSIIDLRRDKIKNLLSLKDFAGTKAFFPYRYEDLKFNGTANLLRNIEEATGLNAKCEATLGKTHRRLREKRITKYRELPDAYIEWMSRYVDWEVENQIGYYRRQ